MDLLLKHLTGKVLEAFYTVYNVLGYGFLEKVYENAMCIELKKMGLEVKRQQKVNVYYEGREVGEYYTDILVENEVIIELKAAAVIVTEHEQQLVNYLKATNKEVGLLLNFGKKPEFKRKVYQNSNKSQR